MSWRSSSSSNLGLLENLRQNGLLTSIRAFNALRLVDRAKFCLPDCDYPYDDCPQSIGYSATISAPHMHAMCLDLLDSHLVEGASVLDVGSGSGYLTAAMAYMVRPGGLAVGVEHVPQLADWSIENIKMANPELIKEGVVQIVSADGRKGVPEKAPFDVIHVGAASLGKPTELMKQLKVGGRMVVPVERTRGDQLLMTIDRVGEDQFQEHVITSVRYVPLTDKKKQLTGQTDYY